MGVYLVLIGADLRPVQGRARRLRADAGQAISGRLCAIAGRRDARPHRGRDPPDERHRAEAAGRRERGRVSGPVDQRLHQQLERRHRVRDAEAVRGAQERRPQRQRHRDAAQSEVRRHQGGLHRDVPAAAGAGPRHHRRLQAADRGPRRPRLRGARRGDQGVPRQGRAGARARRRVLQLPGQRAAALCRHRPHQGAPARRRGDRRVRDDADLSRLALRQRLQPVRPHLFGARAGRRAVPRPRRGHRPAQGALGAPARWCRLRRCCRCRQSAGPERAMRYNGFLAADINGAPGARLFDRAGAGGDRAHRGRNAAEGHQLRMDRAHLSRKSSPATRRSWCSRLRPAGVPGARRALRKPDAAAGDHPDRADGPARGDRAACGSPAATTTSSRRSA